LCGTRTAVALRVAGTNLQLTVPGYELFEITGGGTFAPVSAITGSGGEYEFLAKGSSPVFLEGTGTCVKIPLPTTGGAKGTIATTPSPAGMWLWPAALSILLGVAAAAVIRHKARQTAVCAVEDES
jgi:hypothetical protein